MLVRTLGFSGTNRVNGRKARFRNRKAVVGESDIFNVILLAVDDGIYDVVLIDLRSGDETG